MVVKNIVILSVCILLLVSCGCIAPFPARDHTNVTAFAEEIHSGQNYYDDLVISDPPNATAWLIRGMYYNDAFGQYEEALRSYNRSLELDPDNALAWYAKGITLQNMHRLNESKICFGKAGKSGMRENT